MTDRERLIELLEGVPVSYELCMRMKGHCPTTEKPCYECLVDYLLDNGVTFAKDMDVPSKWISVEDDTPKDRRAVLACVFWHEKWQTLPGWYAPSSKTWYITTYLGGMTGFHVSHWREVPEPPKEVE